MIKVSELQKNFPQLILGELEADICCSKISPPNNFKDGDLIFCSNESDLQSIQDDQASAGLIITKSELQEFLPKNTPVLFTDNPRLTQAIIKQFAQDYQSNDHEWDTIHESATIHPSASIGNNCRIGPNTVIGENVHLGNNVIIRSNCVIEHDSSLGDDCIIHNLVNIGYNSLIGNRVIIYSGAVIGNEGFGFALDENHRYHRIPHTGNVLLGDDVRIGSNCNIDRGTYGPTEIKRGTKIDALCHIAHNVEIGEDCALAAQSGVAGSSVIGNRVIFSGHSAVADHVNVADDVILVHRAGVISDIKSKGMWAGTPQKPMKEYVKNLNHSKKLEKQIKEMEITLDRLKQQLDSQD